MAMSLEEAQAIARRLVTANPRLKNVNMDTLVAKIMANEGMDRGAIQTPGGMSEETLFAGLLPKTITPASPAPVQPGVQLAAPKPTAAQIPQPAMGGPDEGRQLLPDEVRQMALREAAPPPAPAPELIEEAPRETPRARAGYVSPRRAALEEAERELGLINGVIQDIVDAKQPVPPEAKMRLDLTQRRAQQLRAEVAAEESAQVPQEIADVLARQEERIKSEGERVSKAEKDASADALIKAGLALMNPQRGANALAAISQGLGVGLETYDTAKAAAAERRARLGQGQDELVLKRFEALTNARDKAVAAAQRGQQLDRDNLALINASDQALFNKATMDTRIEREGLDTDLKRIQKQYAPAEYQSQIDLRGAQKKYYEDGGGRGGSGDPNKPMTENQRRTKILQLNRERRAAIVDLNTPGTTLSQKEAIKQAIAGIDAELAELTGNNPYGKPVTGPVALKPDLEYKLGTGIVKLK